MSSVMKNFGKIMNFSWTHFGAFTKNKEIKFFLLLSIFVLEWRFSTVCVYAKANRIVC